MGATGVSPWTVVVTGPGNQEVGRYPLRTDKPLTIGRAPDCNVMLGVMTIARNQGRIEFVNNFPTYVAEPGSQGALVDGDPVDGPAMLGERTLLEIGPFRFALQRARAAAPPPKPAAAAGAWTETGTAGTLLDQHIQGVRLHRTETRKEMDDRRSRWEQGWRELIGQARQIQAHYARHPSILEFTVTKDDREVIVKMKDSSPRGYAYFVLSRVHPEGKYPDMEAVWLREVGRGDDSFSEPRRGLEELVSRIAPRLA